MFHYIKYLCNYAVCSTVQVNGERNPAEVYNDFRAAVLRILGPLTNGLPPMPAPTTAVSVYNPPSGQNKAYPSIIWVIGKFFVIQITNLKKTANAILYFYVNNQLVSVTSSTYVVVVKLNMLLNAYQFSYYYGALVLKKI